MGFLSLSKVDIEHALVETANSTFLGCSLPAFILLAL